MPLELSRSMAEIEQAFAQTRILNVHKIGTEVLDAGWIIPNAESLKALRRLRKRHDHGDSQYRYTEEYIAQHMERSVRRVLKGRPARLRVHHTACGLPYVTPEYANGKPCGTVLGLRRPGLLPNMFEESMYDWESDHMRIPIVQLPGGLGLMDLSVSPIEKSQGTCINAENTLASKVRNTFEARTAEGKERTWFFYEIVAGPEETGSLRVRYDYGQHETCEVGKRRIKRHLVQSIELQLKDVWGTQEIDEMRVGFRQYLDTSFDHPDMIDFYFSKDGELERVCMQRSACIHHPSWDSDPVLARKEPMIGGREGRFIYPAPDHPVGRRQSKSDAEMGAREIEPLEEHEAAFLALRWLSLNPNFQVLDIKDTMRRIIQTALDGAGHPRTIVDKLTYKVDYSH